MNMRGMDIPFVQMGKVSSADMFEDREQEAFDLYERHKGQYWNVLDIGANIGIHTVFMAKLGWNVMAFEPDPEHQKHWTENVARNDVTAALSRFALSYKTRNVTFVRVLGNTTASHIEGARDHHGPVERIEVKSVVAWPYFIGCDFAKVDAEGAEADILCTVPPDTKCEMLVEIGSEENARRIYEHFKSRKMWAQGPWREVKSLADVPTHYKQGSLFIGEQP